MTQDTRTIENRLKWAQDQQSANAVIQSNKAIAGSFGSVADAASQLGLSTDQIKQLNTQLGGIATNGQQGAAGINATTQATQSLTTSTQQLAAATNQVAVARKTIHDIGVQSQSELPDPGIGAFAGEGGSSSPAGTLRGLSQSAIALPGVGFQSPLVLGLRGLSTIADKTGASVGQLAAGVGIAGVAVVAITVALARFKEGLAASKALLDGALAAQKNYYQAVGTLTTKQADEQIATLQRQQDALRLQAAEAQKALESDFQQRSSGILGQASAVAQDVLGISGYAQLKKASDDANAALQENVQTETRLTQGRDAGAFAANDAAEAEEKLKKAREESASQLIAAFDQEANTRTRLAELRRSGSTDQVNAELDANKDRETIIRNFLLPAVASLGLTTEAATKRTQELNTELLNLQHNDKLLVDAVEPVVAQREAEVALLKAQKDASDALNPILQDINKSQVDLGQASEKTAAALASVQQAETDHASKLTEIQATYDDATEAARIKLGDQLAKIDQSAAEKQLTDRENLNSRVTDLVATGHIAEAQQAIRAQRLKEQQDARQVQQQKDDAQKQYSDQLKAADQQRDKLLKSEADRYSKELQQRRAAYDQAVRDQQFLNNRIQSLRDQEQLYTRSWISAQVTALYKVQDATGNFTAAMSDYAARINANIQAGGAAWHPTNNGGGSSGGHLPGEVVGLPPVTGTAALRGRATPTAFDTPSFNRYPGLFISRVPEYHIPVADFNRMGGVGAANYNVSVTVNAQGSNMSPAERQKLKEETKTETIQALASVHAKQKKGGAR